MNYQTKVNASIRAGGINSFSLHKYFIHSGGKTLKRTQRPKEDFCCANTFSMCKWQVGPLTLVKFRVHDTIFLYLAKVTKADTQHISRAKHALHHLQLSDQKLKEIARHISFYITVFSCEHFLEELRVASNNW